MGVSENVTRWADVLEQACRDVGVDGELELGVMLALVATESSGDPDVVNRFGFTGLLQIGSPFLQDAREWFASKRRPAHIRALLKEIPTRKSGLIGDARASALVTCAVFERYEVRHNWEPVMLATLHKGGPGTAKKVLRMRARGMSLEAALEQAEEENPRLGDLTGYVLDAEHFGGHYPEYKAWADAREDALHAEQEAARVEAMADEPPVCEPVDEDPLELLERALRLFAQREASS